MKNKKKLTILLTGGGSGIGAALTKALSEEGHTVIICGRRCNRLAEVARANNNVYYFVCDVSDEENVIDFSNFVREKFDSERRS